MASENVLVVLDGEWKNFRFRMLTPEDVPMVEDHMRRNFFSDNPLFVYVGITDANCMQLNFNQLFQELISHNLTFAAFDKASGKMASVRAVCRHTKIQDDSAPVRNCSEELKVLGGFLETAARGFDIYSYYKVDEYAHLRWACVDKEFRNLGLATEMYRRGMALLKQSGFKVAASVFTGPYSRAAGFKFGFVEFQRRYFKTITDLQGNFLSPDAGDQEYASLMVARI